MAVRAECKSKIGIEGKVGEDKKYLSCYDVYQEAAT
jgi:hypothetical protein